MLAPAAARRSVSRRSPSGWCGPPRTTSSGTTPTAPARPRGSPLDRAGHTDPHPARGGTAAVEHHMRGREHQRSRPRSCCWCTAMGSTVDATPNWRSFLTKNGLAVQSFDLRGHGRSGGARGHSPSHEHLMRDIDLLFADADQHYPGSARILYGHSMGGQLALNYTLRRHPRVSGVVATSPALRTWFGGPPIKRRLGRVLGSLIPAAVIHTPARQLSDLPRSRSRRCLPKRPDAPRQDLTGHGQRHHGSGRLDLRARQ
jgi:alpha-beta hydrolase superfamily lysophospholipase